MTILIFILVLSFIVFIHELGHFLAAKRSGMRVDEFGIGFPPRIAAWRPQGSETEYSINALPIGGFVRIFGEDYEAVQPGDDAWEKSFASKRGRAQIFVLAAGVAFNVLLAWVLYSGAFMMGTFAPSTPENREAFLVAAVEPGSPANEAGLQAGDDVTSITTNHGELNGVALTEETFREAIVDSEGDVVLAVKRNGEPIQIEITPKEGVVSGAESNRAIGVLVQSVATERSGFFESLYEGGRQTVYGLAAIWTGVAVLLKEAVSGGGAALGQVTGPIGIAALAGQAQSLGFSILLSFAAFISLNLAVLNLLPLPALDGGRILFVFIEKIKGSPIKPKIARNANLIGFSLLMLLMLVVAYRDIMRLF